MQNYHKHTDYSNVLVSDCTATYKDYVKRAKELGHKVISSVEHGYQSNYYIPYELVTENNAKAKERLDCGEITREQYEKELLKFVFGAEAYWVKDRHEKDRSNCHIILLAKNEEGRQDINEVLSDANIDGYYGQPRVDLELLTRINPQNVMVTSACVAYWKYDDIDEITLKLYEHFKENFFLEIQCHNTEAQKKINRHILELHQKYGIDIIYGYDSHYIYEKESVERDNYISTRRKGYSKDEDDEQGWYMDYPDEQTVIKRLKIQGILSDEEISRCIANTDLILGFDDLYFDKEIKLPSSNLSMSQEQKNEALKNLVYSKWDEVKKTIPKERHQEYLDGINYELQAIIDTNMADYFLIDYKIVKRGIEKGGIITKTGRGSGVSYYVNSLLGFSDIDRFSSPVKLYPDRFMSKTRILQTRSLPDLDLNLGNPEVFAEAQDEVLTEIYKTPNHSYPMISYKPLQSSSAFKLYAKSQNIDFSIANEITEQIARYEKDYKNAETPEEKAELNIYDYVDKKYHNHLDESKKYRGIINAKSQAPCGYLIYGGNIKREIGLIRCVSGNQEDTSKSVITTVIDGMIAENYKFVKNDLLKVDIWLTVNKIFEKIGKKTYSVAEMTKCVEGDTDTWDIYKNGYLMGINQCESDFAKNACMRYKPQNMQELTALVAALRPGFKTQLENFLERKPYSTGVKELDNLLKDSFHYIMYQENIMTYLGWLGIEQTETYAIIKKISKKKFKEKELKELKEKLLGSWVEYTGKEDGFEKTWSIMEAFSKYAFNASHAYSYAYDSVYSAYLKAHYPYEFYSVMMQHLTEKGDKDKVTAYKAEMQKAFKIKVGEYKFRDDNRKFTAYKDRGYISPSLTSLKNFSDIIAEKLYSLKDNKYELFADLLNDLKQNGIADARIQTLISINYFSEFGNIKYLEKYFEVFNLFYGNKGYKSQYKKENALEDNIDFDILKANCKKDTPKTFMGIDARNIIEQIMKNYKFYEISNKEIIQRRYEALGYLDVVDKKYTGFCFCMEVDSKYSPKLKLYALANGGIIPVKISKKDFNKNPIKCGDIIKVLSQYKKPKMYKEGDKWIESSEKEWWLTEYQIV